VRVRNKENQVNTRSSCCWTFCLCFAARVCALGTKKLGQYMIKLLALLFVFGSQGRVCASETKKTRSVHDHAAGLLFEFCSQGLRIRNKENQVSTRSSCWPFCSFLAARVGCARQKQRKPGQYTIRLLDLLFEFATRVCALGTKKLGQYTIRLLDLLFVFCSQGRVNASETKKTRSIHDQAAGPSV